MTIWSVEHSSWILLYTWKSHRFLLGYCLNKQYGIRSSHCMSGWGFKLIPTQHTNISKKSGRQWNGALCNIQQCQRLGDVLFYRRICWSLLWFFFFLHTQLFKSPQKLNSIWKNNAAPFTSLQHWGTFSHCSDISPSLTRVVLVCSNHWRNTENTFYCSAWKRKINFKDIILQILIIWQCCDRQRGNNCHSYN